jgi:nucleotide-binding universal stress UspA family protein
MSPSFRRILHATDFSSASRKALAKAVDLARKNRAELWIAHVLISVVPPGLETMYATPRMYDEMEAAIRKSALQRLDRLVARASKSGARCRGLLLVGLPHDEILRAAKRQKADLIVIGTHGRTGAALFFLGSVAARVIAGSSCPVLAVRGR